MPPGKTPASPSTARLTAQDVATHAGVSLGTVSRVVNNVSGVKPAVAERVRAAISELGWAPNIAAQNMRNASSRMIGFIFSDIRNPLYASMAKGAEEVLGAKGYLLVTASSDGIPDREVALIELFKRRRADGMILTVEQENNDAVLAAIRSADIPHVMMERELPIGSTSIGADHYRGTRHAVDYLLSLGHRRIALISGGPGTLVARDRLRALVDSLAAADLDVDPDLLCLESFASEYACRQTQQLLRRPNPPTAILSLGARLLPGVLEGLQLMGKRYPDDVSLICSNDTDIARIVTPAVTAVRYDAMGLGRVAAESLLDQVAGRLGGGTVSRIEVPTELVLRGSCRAV